MGRRTCGGADWNVVFSSPPQNILFGDEKWLKARSSELRTGVLALLTLVATRTCFFTRPVSKAVALMTCGKARRFRSTKHKAKKAPVLKTSRQPEPFFLKTSFSNLEILLLWVTKEAKT